MIETTLFQKINHDSLYVLAINEDIIEKLKIAMVSLRGQNLLMPHPDGLL